MTLGEMPTQIQNRRAMHRRGKDLWLRAASLPVSALLLSAIWIGAKAAGAGDGTLPSIGQTLSALGALLSDGYRGHSFLAHIAATTWRLAVGWGMAVFLGATAGWMLGVNNTIRVLVDPLLTLLRFAAPLSFLGLFIGWFGVGLPPLLVATGLVPFLIVLDGVARARHQIDLNPDTDTDTVRHVVLTLRLSLVVALLVLARAEVVGTDVGLGVVVASARNFVQIDVVYAALVSLGTLGFVFDHLIRFGGRTYGLWPRA